MLPETKAENKLPFCQPEISNIVLWHHVGLECEKIGWAIMSLMVAPKNSKQLLCSYADLSHAAPKFPTAPHTLHSHHMRMRTQTSDSIVTPNAKSTCDLLTYYLFAHVLLLTRNGVEKTAA